MSTVCVIGVVPLGSLSLAMSDTSSATLSMPAFGKMEMDEIVLPKPQSPLLGQLKSVLVFVTFPVAVLACLGLLILWIQFTQTNQKIVSHPPNYINSSECNS